MGKALKIIGIVAALLIVLFLVAGVVLTQIIDPNKYKAKISQEVLQTTGQQLMINGAISWSFFPWIGLKVSDVILNNPQGFGGTMATVKEADVKVALLPLFFHKIDIDDITLNKLQLNLIKDRNGQGNWQHLMSAKKPASSTTTDSSSTSNISFQINNIDISGGDINWQDNQAGQNIQLKNISIQGKDVGLNNPFSLNMSAQVISTNPQINANIAVSGDFDIDGGFSRFSLTDFTTKINDLTISGNMSGTARAGSVNYTGNVKVAQFNPKSWLRSMNLPTIDTANSKALTQFSGSINFKGTNNSLNMNTIEIKLDDSNLTGNFFIQSFKNLALQFKLQVDQLNADNYLPKASNAPSVAASSSNAATNQNLPIDSLRNLNIAGSMAVNKLTMMKLHVTNASVAIDARGGLIKLPIKADLYGGSTTTNISYDVRSATPMLGVTSNLSKVQMKPLVTDFMNIDKFSGQADFSLMVNGQGANANSILQTLGGSGQFSLTNGKIEGVNLSYQVQRAAALLKKTAQPSQPKSNDTDINVARGTFKITNGIVSNNDLQIQAQSLQATGDGNINLPAQNVNYSLYLTSSDLQGQKVPFRITGPFTNVSYNLDVASLIEAAARQQAQAAIQQQLGDKIGGQGQQLLNKILG